MPSPFPGMDPFIEGQRWRDFHTSLIVAISHEYEAELDPPLSDADVKWVRETLG